MPQSLAHIALIVRDYDEAIAWFTEKLGFTPVADEHQPEQDKRWVLVAPPGARVQRASVGWGRNTWKCSAKRWDKRLLAGAWITSQSDSLEVNPTRSARAARRAASISE